jgi:hypothetical protein
MLWLAMREIGGIVGPSHYHRGTRKQTVNMTFYTGLFISAAALPDTIDRNSAYELLASACNAAMAPSLFSHCTNT